jgi:beta-glucosidase
MAALASAFPKGLPANLGISGDRVQHVLWRVENGALDRTPAKTVVVMIGINNYPDDSPEAVGLGIENLVRRIRQLRPDLRVVVHGLLGSEANKETLMGRWVNDVNTKLAKSKAAPFCISPEWRTPESEHPRFARDGVHLTTAGYATYARSIREAAERAR